MKFSASVSYTVSGWIEFEAESLQEAKLKIKKMNVDGIELHDIKDSETNTEVFVDSIEYMGTEDNPENNQKKD